MSDAAERRRALRAHMAERAESGRDCRGCSGVCCTFVANSMQITPVETLDLKRFLEREGRWNEALFAELETCVRDYRLDREPPGDGRRQFVRRRYTCPFFGGGRLGCSIDPDSKPYGCLAFNPEQAGLTEGGACSSETTLLEALEGTEDGGSFQPDWAKKAIPVALLELARRPEDGQGL